MAGELKKQIQREIKGDRRRHRERSGGFVLVWQHGCLANRANRHDGAHMMGG
jgi:hypothetical protein